MKVRIASAGTGKTTTLAHRYLEALEDLPPYRLVAVTFTRMAAADLRTRILETLMPQPELWVQALSAPILTIHGFFAELLRLAAPRLGLSIDFQQVDASLAEGWYTEAARSLLYLEDLPETPWLSRLLALFQKRSLAPTLVPLGPESARLNELFERALQAYHRRVLSTTPGPSDVERLAYRLLVQAEREAGLRDRLAARFKRVFIDEFQDTSPLQGEVFSRLEALGVAVEVVGDPKQSIYAFRNADVEVFRRARARGDALPPLRTSYRHARSIVAFLNRLTRALGEASLGFTRDEAETVEGHREAEGEVRLWVVRGEGSLDQLRRYEADLLARELKKARSEGLAWREMAILVRSYASIRFLERALSAYGMPYVVFGARGFFELPEIKALYYAIVGPWDPGDRYALATFLQGPFVGLSLEDAVRIASNPDPERALAEFPKARARFSQLAQAVRVQNPLAYLEWLVRTRFDGANYLECLPPARRANVDALLMKIAEDPPSRMEFLIQKLDRFRRFTDEGALVEGGQDAIRVLTIHKAKGLEWPLVAVFDLNRGARPDTDELHVRPHAGEFALKGEPAFDEIREAVKAREIDEVHRLLYVALSRARDRLWMTMSLPDRAFRQKAGNPAWVLAERLGIGRWEEVEAREVRAGWKLPGVKETPEPESPEGREKLLAPIRPAPFFPVDSPTGLKSRDAGAFALEDPRLEAGAGEAARAIGVLVHQAIAMNWRPDDPRDRERLFSQEVFLRLDPGVRSRVASETSALLRKYHAMLGTSLPDLPLREVDRAEVGLVLPYRGVVWEGVIDRIYRVGSRWYLDDYKTDRVDGGPDALLEHARAAGYLFQLALYRKAVMEAWSVEPEVRLIYLRPGRVLTLDPDLLAQALELRLREALGG